MLLLTEENATEAAVVSGVAVYPVANLRAAVELIAALAERRTPAPLEVDHSRLLAPRADYAVDLREVRGQQSAKRALEVASPT